MVQESGIMHLLTKRRNMKNSYQGYWFSCETSYSDDIGNRKWNLLLENKSNNKINSIGLNNSMSLQDVMNMAFDEIEKLNKENV